MITIRLRNRSWSYDPSRQVGPEGGFGTVYRGQDKNGQEVAIKKLKFGAHEAGHRELEIAEIFANRAFNHIIPVYDSGQDSESDFYFIVMTMAEKSLKDDLDKGIQFSDLETAKILLSIISGLEELPQLVHRDLKPGNILFHENTWKVADFGIARFVERSTSLRTLKECLTYPYAAPEQLRLETSTRQIDIYSLGCVGYELLTGSPPFTGQSREQVREKHLHSEPPPLTNHHSLLCSLLAMMLRKNPDARPSHTRLREQLKKVAEEPDGHPNRLQVSELQRIGQEDAQIRAKKEAEEQSREEARRKRDELATEAYRVLHSIIEKLFRAISENAPTADRAVGSHRPFTLQTHSISLGKARLTVKYLVETGLASQSQFTKSGWDVVAGAVISISQEAPEYRWGASLWYMKRHPSNDYRWHEVPYMSNPFTRNPPKHEPFELTRVSLADEAAAPGTAAFQHAHPPEPIDVENENDFIDNWLKRFIQAYRGQLQRPSRLPY